MEKPREDDKAATLRQQAEKKLAKRQERLGDLAAPDLQKLLHELSTHQIELEMQNEELRQSRTELEASHRKYADLYDYSPVGYFTFDRNGLIEQVNHTGAGMLGLGKGQLVGWPIWNLIAPADLAAFRAHLAEVFASGKRQTCEISLILEGGRLLPVQLVSCVPRDGEEAHSSCRTAVSDITERKRVEEVLRLRTNELEVASAEAEKQRRFLASVMEVLPSGVAITDDRGGNIQSNRAFEEIWGGPRPETSSVDDYEAYRAWWVDTGKPVAPGEWASAQAMARGETVAGQLLRLQRFDGGEALVLNSAAPVRDQAGKIIGCAVAIQDISELKRAEAALRDNELLASALINSADESIWLFSLASEVLAANTTGARRMGLSVAEVVGKNCRDLLSPPLAAARMAKFEECVRSGSPVGFEDERAGMIFEHTVYPVREVGGAITAVAVFSRDITERRQAELARERLSRELYQLATELDTVFEALPVLVSLHDREGRYLRVNPALKELFGFDPTHADRAEIAGRLRARLPDGRPLTVENMPTSRVLQGETVSGVEYLLDDAQGREHVMLFNAVPLRTEEGQVSGMVLAQMDITERKVAEEAWRQVQLDLARAQQVGQIGSWRLDVRRNILTWSEENHRIFGIPPGTPLTYETFLAAVHPDDRAYVDTRWQAALAGEPYDLEHRLLVAGQVVWVREKAYLEFESDGALRGGFGITQDISERKQAEAAIRGLNERLGQKVAELVAVNKELQGFTYSVSHDLRAPIRHIAGFAQLLEKKIGPDLGAEGREFLAYITGAAQKLGVLVDELLEFSRMGRAEIGRAEVDLGPLVSEVVEKFRRETGSRRIDWQVGKLPVVHGEATMLRFVVENLIANAVKFTGPRAQAAIEVGYREETDRHIISVKDNGVGFDMTHYNKLFGVFQRLHRQEEFPGTGIGLANVQRIIQRHGGEVWAESKIDEGATFFFTLPKEPRESM